MLPENHFLSLAVKEAMKPHKDWEVDQSDEFLPDFFNVPAPEAPKPPNKPSGPPESSATIPDGPLHQLRLSSSSDGAATPIPSQGATNTSHADETYGILLAQLHFHLSVLSKDKSYVRLPVVSNLHTLPLLGSGHSFIVRRATKADKTFSELEGDSFAVKSINIKTTPEATSRMRDVLQEVRILTHVPLRSHANIVKLLGFGWEKMRDAIDSKITRWPVLVLEHAEFGSAVGFLEEHVVTIGARVKICVDVGLGLEAVHASNIVHGDVKLENILIFRGEDNRPVAKIADFGFAAMDLGGDEPAMEFTRGTAPWRAPEAKGCLGWSSLFLTDVFSYGMLVWRTICFGHRPFIEPGGSPNEYNFLMMEAVKAVDGVLLEMATESVRRTTSDEMCQPYGRTICRVLEYCLPAKPEKRDFKAAILTLGGALRAPPSPTPLRIQTIPVSHGLGIYKYNAIDNRLYSQMMLALHSFCYSPLSRVPPLDLFLSHCTSTLSNWFADRWSNGEQFDETGLTTRSRVWRYTAMSALAGSDASAEALYTIHNLLWGTEVENAETSAYPKLAGRALRDGLEFILREVMENDVPGKNEFLDMFTTRLCRGSNMMVPPNPYAPLMDEAFLLRSVAGGTLTHEGMFRMVVTWGQFEVAKRIYAKYNPDVNSIDPFGETALLRACRAGHYDIAVWLLTEAHADPRIGSKLNITPLHWLHVFEGPQCQTLARLLKNSGADANAIAVNNGTSTIEANYYFFKGPPLIRAVAIGNVEAVKALLAIGADLKVPIHEGGEDAVVFAARRLRAPILRLLLEKGPYPVLEAGHAGYNLLAKVLQCHITYAAKIHGQRHEAARIETFNLIWNWEEEQLPHKNISMFGRMSLEPSSIRSPSILKLLKSKGATGRFLQNKEPTVSQSIPSHLTFFRSVGATGRIPIQEAVENGDFISVKHILELTHSYQLMAAVSPDFSQFKEKQATIGLQAAIVYDKRAMAEFFLEQGADPLAPCYVVDYGKKFQKVPDAFDGMSVGGRTNSLHLLARSGGSAYGMGMACVKAILPDLFKDFTESQWTARKTCAIGLTYELHPSGEEGHAILDRKDEAGQTAFFLALQNEEYELASFLSQAGASKNILIRGTPIVEHLLTWPPTSARVALAFLARQTWGMLYLSKHPRRHYLDLSISASAHWPEAQASDFISDVYGYMAPRHDHETSLTSSGYLVGRLDGGPVSCGCKLDWDAHIVKAIEALHVPAVKKLVLERHSAEPVKDAYSRINALRRVVLDYPIPTTPETRRARYAAWKKMRELIPIIHRRNADAHFDVSVLLQNIAKRIGSHLHDELKLRLAQFEGGALSVLGLTRRMEEVLGPYAAVAAGCNDMEIKRLQEMLQAKIPEELEVTVVVKRKEEVREGLEVEFQCKEEDRAVEWEVRRYGEEVGMGLWKF